MWRLPQQVSPDIFRFLLISLLLCSYHLHRKNNVNTGVKSLISNLYPGQVWSPTTSFYCKVLAPVICSWRVLCGCCRAPACSWQRVILKQDSLNSRFGAFFYGYNLFLSPKKQMVATNKATLGDLYLFHLDVFIQMLLKHKHTQRECVYTTSWKTYMIHYREYCGTVIHRTEAKRAGSNKHNLLRWQ